nr:glycoprotein vIgFam6 [Elephant endotheliotropic herpesvirus 1A]
MLVLCNIVTLDTTVKLFLMRWGGGRRKECCITFLILNILGIYANRYPCKEDDERYEHSKNITLNTINNKVTITLPLEQNGTHTLIHNDTIIYTSVDYTVDPYKAHITLSLMCKNSSCKYMLQSEDDKYVSCQLFYIHTNCTHVSKNSALLTWIANSCPICYTIPTWVVIVNLIK